MCDREAAFGAEPGKGLVRIHVEIAGVGSHVAGDETGRIEGFGIAVLDRGDIGCLDPQFALHIKQGFAHCGALTAHHIAQPEFEIVKTLWFYDIVLLIAGRSTTDHRVCPIPVCGLSRLIPV